MRWLVAALMGIGIGVVMGGVFLFSSFVADSVLRTRQEGVPQKFP